MIRGLGALYAELLQPSRPSRAAFLAALVKPFDAAANLNAAPGAAAPSLRQALPSFVIVSAQAFVGHPVGQSPDPQRATRCRRAQPSGE